MVRTAEDREDAVEQRTLLKRTEFLVGDRNRAGQPHACAVFLRQLQVGGRLPDRLRSLGAGFELVEIEDRLHLDQPAQVARARRLAAHQHAPGEILPSARQIGVERVGEHVHRPGEIIELQLLHLNAA